MQLKLGKDFFYIKTPYEDRNFVSQGLNGVWSKKEGMYRFPRNLNAMRELMRSYPQLRNNYQFVEAGKQIKATQEKYLTFKNQEDMEGHEKLRSYQRVDVNYLKQLPSAGIFNEPRTGELNG